MINRLLPLCAFLFLFPLQGSAQDRTFQFPDVGDYVTLVADLHMHTVFSDGSVWPNIRVEEAHLDGLDAIAVTDHLEYLPHRHDIPFPDRNRPHEIAEQANGRRDLLVINGSEVTRRMPLGHVNAIFIQDANSLVQPDSVEALREANRQGAFVFWNHPNWLVQNSTGIAELNPVHQMLISEDALHGIEIANEHTFSDEAFGIALENNLAVLATSDIHGLVDWQFDIPGGGHRPVTLVLAAEHSEAALKEALLARRTVAHFKKTLAGPENVLLPLLTAAIELNEAQYSFSTTVLNVTLTNSTSVPFTLRNVSDYTLHGHTNLITLPAGSTITLQYKTAERLDRVALDFEVLNAFTAPGVQARMTINVTLE